MSRKRPKVREQEADSERKGVEKKEQDEEEYKAFDFMKNKKNVGVAGVFFVFGAIISWFLVPSFTGMVTTEIVSVSADVVGQDTIEYINGNLLREGFSATLGSVTENNGMYEVSVNVKQDGADAGQDVVFYVSGSGQFLFFNEPVDMSEPVERPPEQPDQPTEPPETGVPKSDRPVVNTFIMSYCPFGLQMAKAVIPVMELLGDKVDFNMDYVHYIMHGKKEIDQNNYQHCIERDQPEKFTEYLRCFVQSDDHAKCMTEAGVDADQLGTCLTEIDEQFKITELYEDQSTWSNGRYPPYMVDAELTQQYGVGGSPTFVINGQTVKVNRSPEAVKQAICDAFNTPPEECSVALSTAAEGSGIGPLGSGSASGSGGSCG
jgi:hypothetical protein